MELNGALSNPLEKGKRPLIRLANVVCELRRREAPPAQTPVSPRREPIRAAAIAVVEAAEHPVRVNEVCAALRAQGLTPNVASVRKALHDRSRGKAARLQRVGHGLYASASKSP